MTYREATSPRRPNTTNPAFSSTREAFDSPSEPEPPDMRAAALSYVDHGVFIVPLHTVLNGRCSCNLGRRCPRPGKHPVGFLVRHGSRQASSYRPQIERWWDRMPQANIGVVCGPSGLVVLDVDPRNGGVEALQMLQEDKGVLPETLTSITGGCDAQGRYGNHLIFSDPTHSIKGSKGDGGDVLYPGLEILAAGNLFVAAPSLHKSGRRYSLADPDAAVVVAPEWMRGGLR
jgi:hypothetical protein